MAPLKVIGAGFGRTGTSSLRDALNILGYKTHHMHAFNEEGGRPEMFIEAYDHPERNIDWDYMYQGFDAAVDWPTCSFVKPLMKKYPEAKVILTLRDVDKWYSSVANTIYPKHTKMRHLHDSPKDRMIRRILLDGALEDPEWFEDEDAMKQKYIQQVEWVKKNVPEDRLLILELGAGWSQLCQFLGAPIPEEAYPHSNTAADMQAMMLKSSVSEHQGKEEEQKVAATCNNNNNDPTSSTTVSTVA